MAFNPFDMFRRNQRILFAVLTVFTMFMFVLSFGQNDFFSWFPKWLGSKRGYGEVLAVVDGAKVHRSQLGDLGQRRELANTYMLVAGNQARSNITKYVVDGATKLSEDPKHAIQEFLAVRQAGYVDPQLDRRVRMAQQFPGLAPPVSFEEIIASYDSTLARTQFLLSAVAADPKAKPDDKDIAQVASYLMDLDIHLQGADNSRLYFSNQPNRTARDEFDFLLWLKKADDLGIAYTADDVTTLIREEFRDKATADDWQQALGRVKDTRAYAGNPDNLMKALADEFRVRAAQAAVLGGNYVRAPGPLAVGYDAPYDYFEFYKTLTSPARFGVVTIPADLFLPAVEGKPSESDLRQLYQTARGVEADPARPGIGLRKPREIKVEWLEAKGDEPFYKAAAADQLPKMEALAKGSGFLTFPLGSPLALAAAAAAPTALPDPLLQAEYQQEKERAERDIDAEWYSKPGNRWATGIHIVDSSAVRPQVAAVAVGAEAGSLLTGGPWATAGLAAELAAATYDLQGRTVAMAALLSPSFTLADRLGALADHFARTARPLPQAAYRPLLVEAARKTWAQRIMMADLQEFQKKLAELGAKPDKAEVRAYVQKFVKDRGLTTGASTGLRDQYAIGDDPGLAPLKAKLAGPHGALGAMAPQVQFGRQFFVESGFTQQGRFEQEARGVYQARPYPDPQFDPMAGMTTPALVWRTEEKAAENPRDLNPEVRAKAEAGWRKLEARKKAKAAADELAKQCASLGADEATIYKNLQDKIGQFTNRFPTPEAKARVKYFEMRDVAPLVTSNLPLAGRSAATPFEITKTAEIPYPTRKMTEELLAARAKPPSASVVLVDQPEDHYYVAVLYGQSDRTPIEFADAVYVPSQFGESGAAGAVNRRHQEEMKKQARDAAVGLLKAEFRVEKESPDLDKKVDSSSGD